MSFTGDSTVPAPKKAKTDIHGPGVPIDPALAEAGNLLNSNQEPQGSQSESHQGLATNPHVEYDINDFYQVPAGTTLPTQQVHDFWVDIGTQGWNNPAIEAAEEEQLEVKPRSLKYQPTGTTIPADDAVEEEDGRTYHGYKEGAYFLPNDGVEQDRLDLQHHAFKLFYDGRLFKAPLPTPFRGNVLDMGTGTGIWALEFAEENPEATVIGADLSTIQPRRLTAPNCSFVKHDVEDEHWVLGPTHEPVVFDYIHARLVYTCFNSHLAVMQNAYKNLAPGGWIEYIDSVPEITSPDGSHRGTVFALVLSLFAQGGAVIGRDFWVTPRYKHLMAQAGFVDVVEERWQAPIGGWPADPKMRQVGLYAAADMILVVGALGKVLRRAGMSEEQVAALPGLLEKDFRNSHLHFTTPSYIVYGRKPLEGESRSVAPGAPEDVKVEDSAGVDIKQEQS